MWGHDLRVEGIVVEPMHGMDDLAAAVARRSSPARSGASGSWSTTSSRAPRRPRAARQQVIGPNVLVTGHPYVDVWEAVKPATRRHPGVAAGAARHRLEDGGVRGPAVG